VYANNSRFTGNKCGGVGVIQIITNGKGYFYNSTIANNIAGYNSTTSSRNGSGIYVRDGSDVQVVNCTISGNESNGNGAGVALHSSNATTYPETKLTLINSTITGNSSKILDASTAGIYALSAACTVNVYNSIVSGNTGIGTSNYDIDVKTGSTMNKVSSILSDKTYDVSGTEIAGQTFDHATMLGTLAENGGYSKTCQLLGDNNPAKTFGMSGAALIKLGTGLTPAIPENIVAYDQLGNQRTGSMMGAWTSNKVITDITAQNYQKSIIYIENDKICIKSNFNDRIAVYDITGQQINQTHAVGDLTKISNLKRNNLYIVKVNDQSTKVVF